MLKSKLDQAGFEALSEGEKQHYTADATGAYLLQTEDALTLKRSLATERVRADTMEKWLKSVFPELPADKADWADYVTEQAAALTELRAVDMEEWKAFKAADPADPKKPKAEIDAERLQLAQQVRDITRERDTLQRDLGKITVKAEKLGTENVKLERTMALNGALDAARILDPADREVVTALLQMRGLEAQEVTGQGRVFFAKTAEGHDLPLGEYMKEFVASEQGKRYVKAPDSAGTGDGPVTPANVPVARSKFEEMSPSAKLQAALNPGGVRDMPAAAAPLP